MKATIQRALQALLLVPVLALGVSAVVPAQPVDALGIQGGADAAKSDDQSDNLFDEGGLFQTITNVLLFLIGAIAVIMLIIGGIRYTVSGGDSAAITAAKNTILYAIIGIIVAILAYAIVNWVIGSFVA
ncbi:TPA: hypothetical protein DIV49_03985 [Candidatus Saccharibacteria bacterium]|nr:hypothetical protein [Candidatus Saccharibacteria bacterium]HRF28088.1 hypothetical protein [Candidatus Saccharibacteria bacterium]HRJ90673.1 hypothetical protein [Candidatus Saccharibacteria bacterium]